MAQRPQGVHDEVRLVAQRAISSLKSEFSVSLCLAKSQQ